MLKGKVFTEGCLSCAHRSGSTTNVSRLSRFRYHVVAIEHLRSHQVAGAVDMQLVDMPSRPPTMMAENSISELSGSSGFSSPPEIAQKKLHSWLPGHRRIRPERTPLVQPDHPETKHFSQYSLCFRLLRVYEKRPRAGDSFGASKQIVAAHSPSQGHAQHVAFFHILLRAET